MSLATIFRAEGPLAAPVAVKASRRQILKAGLTVGAGLVVGFRWSRRSVAETASVVAEGTSQLAPNAFVSIAPDDSVTILSKHIEFGQGTFTGVATMLAEELDADWSRVRVDAAPADAERYNNLLLGPIQGTGGSSAMANCWMQLRRAGATARAMLVEAASSRWNVPVDEITVRAGVVHHQASGRSARFGELVEAAAEREVPAEVKLKDPADFRLIGRDVPKVDVPAKCDGSAFYTQDVALPGILTALIAHPPRFGGKVQRFDAAASRRIAGVVDVVEVPTGVAVLATSFWAAKKGRDALDVTWDDSAAESRSSEQLFAEYHALLDEEAPVARKDSDVEQALSSASKTVEATYELPYLAHAPMETLNCAIRWDGERCEVWAGSQIPTIDQAVIAATLGIGAENVEIHTLYAGGSFGRRATPNADIAGEAASLIKAIDDKAGTPQNVPVKLVWTREDDIRGGRYRPMNVQRLRAGLDDSGRLVAWDHRLVGQSIVAGTSFEGMIQDGIDGTSVEGARGLPYAVPNLRVDLHSPKVGVPVLWWRSVGHTLNAYTTETFFDLIAAAVERDPLAMRLELLGDDHPRLKGVLELVRDRSDWGAPLLEGRAQGVALHESFGSFVAQVVEISVLDDGMPRVHRVVCAVDCGTAINPDNIRAQMEGGLGYGLAAALHNEITLDEGRVVQSNFHDYPALRIDEMPRVDVHIVPSSEAPSGVGEPGVPPIAPAVANAYRALTGHSLRRLPFAKAVRIDTNERGAKA